MKKILALLLCLVMICTMLPTWALAEESSAVETEVTPTEEILDAETAELAETEADTRIDAAGEAEPAENAQNYVSGEKQAEVLMPEEPSAEPAEEEDSAATESPEAEQINQNSEEAEAVEDDEPSEAVLEEPKTDDIEEAPSSADEESVDSIIEEAGEPVVAAAENTVREEEMEKPADLPTELDALFPDSTAGVTRDQAVAWAEAQIGKSLDYDGKPIDDPIQCVDLIYYYYQALGATVLGGNAIDYASNALPSGWQRITFGDGVTAQPGDIAVWEGWENSNGHVAIVHSADDVAMNVIEQNFNYVKKVEKNWTYYRSGRHATLKCFIRPDFNTNQPPVGHVDEIRGTNDGKIYIRGWAYDPDDTGNTSLQLDVYTTKSGYSGGNRYITYCNGKYRPDIDPNGVIGYYHGFELEIPVNERGSQPVYIYAIDTSDPHTNTCIYNGGTVDISEQEPYSISYNANGGTGAPAQTISYVTPMTLSTKTPTRSDTTETITYTLQVYNADSQLSENKINTTKTTKYTFKNWNTAADGSGTSYNAGATYSAGKSVTLYAQWTSSTTVTSVKLPTPSKSGCVFKYWEDIDSANGRTYTDTCNYSKSIRLRAMWEMTLHYDANGGTGTPSDYVVTSWDKSSADISTTVPTRTDETGTYTVTLNANSGSVSPGSLNAKRTTNYTFKNWNTKKDGSGSSYSAGASYTTNASATLYAQWNSKTTTAAVTLPTPTRNGYSFVGWGTSASATSGVTGSYTPSGNVTLYAVWKAEPTPSHTEFVDVADPSAYYYNAVYWAADKGITSGTSSTTFSPGRECTRGQIVTFLWKAMGSPEPSSTYNPFMDVRSSDYFYKAVLWAKERGITSGKTATTFEPGSPCTRGQIVTFLWIAKGRPDPITTYNPFTDVKITDYFYKAVLWAKENGITSGTSDTTFSPGKTCTRAQAVTFLWIASGRP